jgi:hypothetical protein
MQKSNLLKRSLLLFLLSIIMVNTQAQTGLNFQGVARTSNNVILASQAITIKLSILQGSSTGTADYTETRRVTTNAQGLFTAVIGDTGAISTLGNFTTINWKLTPKFLKIEMDAAAGTNFITMGTTQFQYVAYAQFAKTVDAENIVGIVPVALGGTGVNSLTALKTALTLNNVNNTTDLAKPISTLTQTALELKLNASDTNKYTKQTYSDSALLTKLSTTGNAATATLATTATTAGNITATTNTTLTSLSNLATVGTITSGVWSGTAVAVEKGGTGLTAAGTSGQVLTSTGNGTLTWTGTHYIGESYGGGKVFYVYDNGKHGLIAATSDQSTGIRWYGGSNTNTRARGDGVGAGLKNTAIIIANQGAVDGSAFAATVCNEYSVTETVGGITTIYGDWYLPSKHELNLLYLQKTVVGGFTNNLYWSSTEFDNGFAWIQIFGNGIQNVINKFTSTDYVRAIRAF